jgi:hypothetical protein
MGEMETIYRRKKPFILNGSLYIGLIFNFENKVLFLFE